MKEIDLLSYLQNYEPYELVSLGSGTYGIKSHDSLKISNGGWCWWAQGIRGSTALDFLIKVRNMPFKEAVNHILEHSAAIPPVIVPPPPQRKKSFKLPPPCSSQNAVNEYLTGRGISERVLNHCYETGQLYGDQRHNAVFVGFDGQGKPRCASLRGTRSDFIGQVGGSDKRFVFCLISANETPVLHVFESAIDVLSYATLLDLAGKDFRQHNLLSLEGVYCRKKSGELPQPPMALEEYLVRNTYTRQIILHLDNDVAGRQAAGHIVTRYSSKYKVFDRPPPQGKDCNDFLCLRLGISLTPKRKKKENVR